MAEQLEKVSPRERVRVPKVTVVGTVYYQPARGQPKGVKIAYSLSGVEDEQVYERPVQVGPEWQPVEYGWVKNPGMVIVSHDKVVLDVKPTKEQREWLEQRVIQLGILNWAGDRETVAPFQDVYLGTSFPSTPPSFPLLRIRCPNGKARVTVYVIPK